ncbi:Uncharacterised protein [uncultured archaeon]|nr:Uncharacterised protein [uncultured archaeon]
MAIINMCSSQNQAEAAVMELKKRRIEAGNIRQLDPKKCDNDNIWLYDSYIGRCLEDYEINHYDDSDFVMLVAEPNETYSRIEFASTRGWSYPCYGSSIDARPEIRKAYDDYRAEIFKAEKERLELEKIMAPEKGKMLEVIRGRKVPIGITGKCIWVGEGSYSLRVGLRAEDGNVYWTAAKNVQVV